MCGTKVSLGTCAKTRVLLDALQIVSTRDFYLTLYLTRSAFTAPELRSVVFSALWPFSENSSRTSKRRGASNCRCLFELLLASPEC